MLLDHLIRDRREAILFTARKHGARKMSVFGSRARGDARPDSDADILVEAGENTSPFFPGGLLADLQDILGCRVDVAEPDGLHPAIRDQVLREAVQL